MKTTTASLPSGLPRFTVDGAIARITLQRPAHRNRLHNEDLSFLKDLFDRIDADLSIAVLVVGAEVLPARPVFSAGYNIEQFGDEPPLVSYEDVTQVLEGLRPITICALNGSVYGGSTDMVLACDLAIAADDIELRVPAAALGLHYHAGGLARYVSRLGVGVAKQMLLAAQRLDAQTLLRVGFVQELVPRAELARRVDALASEVAALAPLSLRTMKQSLNELARGEFDVARLRERQSALKASEDFAEGRKAFAERRAPVWRGR